MTYQTATHPAPSASPGPLPDLPRWAASGRLDTVGAVAVRSGAALTLLDAAITEPAHGVPVHLLANRLALTAAAATSRLEGRATPEAEIRDAFHLAPAGALRGPDGDLLAFWRRAVRLRLTGRAGIGRLPEGDLADASEAWLREGAACAAAQGPLAGCAVALRAVLAADDRAERDACLISDIVLARALSWPSVLPVTASRLSKAMLRELRTGGQAADLAVQARLLAAIEDALRLARDLARRAAALRAVAPKLRARGSDAAVSLFLADDTVAPAALRVPAPGTGPAGAPGTGMTDRAARRFCERLVELGVARELTGRASFRLYGIAP